MVVWASRWNFFQASDMQIKGKVSFQRLKLGGLCHSGLRDVSSTIQNLGDYCPLSTPPKFNIDTKNDGLENVCPFKYGYFGYPCFFFLGCVGDMYPNCLLVKFLPSTSLFVFGSR